LGRARILQEGEAPVLRPEAPGVSVKEDGGTDSRKIALWAILGAGVALLGGMVFSLTRQKAGS
jgi:hypothetical protein